MRRLWAAVIANLLLGVPGIVVIYLSYYYLSNGPLADLGWTAREPTENDGTLVMSLFLVPIVLGYLIGWCIVNWLLARSADLSRCWFWTTGVLAFLTPTLVVMML